MLKDYEKLFTYIKPPKPSADLFGKVMGRINRERHSFKVKIRLIVFSFVSLISIVFLIPAASAVLSSLLQSGFISLIFSDFSMIVSAWQDFLILFLETLPVMNIILFLGALLLLLGSLRIIARDIVFFKSSLITNKL